MCGAAHQGERGPHFDSELMACHLFIAEVFGAEARDRWASLVAQTVKSPPAMQENLVQSLGWEDSLEKGNGYPLQYSCQENPHGVTRESDMTKQLTQHFFTFLGHLSKDDSTIRNPALTAVVGKTGCVQLVFSFYLDRIYFGVM